jgi:hypothetical protein
MRIELILFVIAGFLMANIYTDGKILKQALSYKKYYKMAGIAFGAFILYVLFKKNPTHARNLIATSNEYIKYLPVDKNTSSVLNPILDFTSRHAYSGGNVGGNAIDSEYPILEMPQVDSGYKNRIMTSGKGATKRSVSESKKKFVAHRQGWKCNHCKKVLPASFEVDHVVRLQHGGSNHVDNLVALCRECHGEKTIMENL